MLSETEGCEVLLRVFKQRGFTIVRNAPFKEHGVEFVADGWDAWARVGFEFMTHEAEDHLDLPPEQLEELRQRTKAGELALFIIDETLVEDAAALEKAAHAFLDQVAARRP